MNAACDVCLPVYNPGAYLRPCLDSILAQSFTNIQVYVTDDQSQESVQEVAASYHDRRIQYSLNYRRLGIGANWNRAARMGQAPFIAVFHQDDVMRPENLARKIAFMAMHPEAVLVGSDADVIDEKGKLIDSIGFAGVDGDCLYGGGEFIRESVLEKNNHLCCPSVVMRRDAYERVGGFSTKYKFALDMDMWVRLAGCGAVGYIPEALIAHRRHAKQTSTRFEGWEGLKEEYDVKRSAIKGLSMSSNTDGLMKEIRGRYITRIIRNYSDRGFRRGELAGVLATLTKIAPMSMMSKDALYIIAKGLFK